MTTLEMEVALMRYLDIRKNLIVNGVHWGLCLGGKVFHECDLLAVNKSGYATEVEIKVSRSDLNKDFEKSHGHDHSYIKNLYYAVPEKLKEHALTKIPDTSGLLVVVRSGRRLIVKEVKSCKARKDAVKWGEGDRLKLARLGTMRILGFKQKLLKLKK